MQSGWHLKDWTRVARFFRGYAAKISTAKEESQPRSHHRFVHRFVHDFRFDDLGVSGQVIVQIYTGGPSQSPRVVVQPFAAGAHWTGR